MEFTKVKALHFCLQVMAEIYNLELFIIVKKMSFNIFCFNMTFLFWLMIHCNLPEAKTSLYELKSFILYKLFKTKVIGTTLVNFGKVLTLN